MIPAFSVIFLTTASGIGYGVLAWLGVLTAAERLPLAPWFGPAAALLGLAMAAAGMLASMLHLGRPERAWRAVSQWRSSWLSREGVLALFTNLPALAFAASWAFSGARTDLTIALGLFAGLCGLLTVASQAMIYATLKPVRQWYNGLVLPNLLLLSVYSGAVWLAALSALWLGGIARAAAVAGVVFGVVALAMKLVYWRRIDSGRAVATIESATGLGSIGPVRMLEAAHTEENFLLREMGYAIARKHAAQLRGIAALTGFAVPLVLLLAGIFLRGPASPALYCVAALLVLLGIYIERWLFFAEATHTVTLYYGRPDTAPARAEAGARV